MQQVKFTKSELRDQQNKLSQLQRYLPTLQLKKAMLQLEINQADQEIDTVGDRYTSSKNKVEAFSALLKEQVECDLLSYCQIERVEKEYENIAGVEIPIFKSVIFSEQSYFLFDTPVWTDTALTKIKQMLTFHETLNVVREKKRALEKELEEVSIRVNLFEKVLIPRAKGNIKKIKIFLGDQQLAEISQAKVAKAKINQRKNT